MSDAAHMRDMYAQYDRILDAFQNGIIDEAAAVEAAGKLSIVDRTGTTWGLTAHRVLWSEDPTGYHTEPADPDSFAPHAPRPGADDKPAQAAPSAPRPPAARQDPAPPQPSDNLPAVWSPPAAPAGPKDSIVDGARRWRDFSGVSTRAQFWWWQLVVTVALTVLQILAAVADAGVIGTVLFAAVWLATLVPTVAVTVRRTRDVGLPALAALALAAPFGVFVVAGWCAAPSQRR